MKWESKKKRRTLYFEDAARFNWAMDTNKELHEGLTKLTERFSCMSEEEYIAEMLALFQRAGLELNDEELRMLLALRQKTDQILLHRKEDNANEHGD